MEKTCKEYLEEILCSKISDDLTGSQKQALEAVTELIGFCDYERLCELAKVDKNAMCVVLPCHAILTDFCPNCGAKMEGETK